MDGLNARRKARDRKAAEELKRKAGGAGQRDWAALAQPGIEAAADALMEREAERLQAEAERLMLQVLPAGYYSRSQLARLQATHGLTIFPYQRCEGLDGDAESPRGHHGGGHHRQKQMGGGDLAYAVTQLQRWEKGARGLESEKERGFALDLTGLKKPMYTIDSMVGGGGGGSRDGRGGGTGDEGSAGGGGGEGAHTRSPSHASAHRVPPREGREGGAHRGDVQADRSPKHEAAKGSGRNGSRLLPNLGFSPPKVKPNAGGQTRPSQKQLLREEQHGKVGPSNALYENDEWDAVSPTDLGSSKAHGLSVTWAVEAEEEEATRGEADVLSAEDAEMMRFQMQVLALVQKKRNRIKSVKTRSPWSRAASRAASRRGTQGATRPE